MDLKGIANLTSDACLKLLEGFDGIRGEDDLVSHSGYIMARVYISSNRRRTARSNRSPDQPRAARESHSINRNRYAPLGGMRRRVVKASVHFNISALKMHKQSSISYGRTS